MAFDEALAERVRALLHGPHMLKEKRMFGGLAFMVNGHMCCGIVGKDFVVRTGPDQYEKALSQPHARPMDFTRRPMRGFVYVAPEGYRSTRDLEVWIQRACISSYLNRQNERAVLPTGAQECALARSPNAK